MIDGKIGRVPNHAHIVADDRASPYGTRNRKGLLIGATVHFCHLEADAQFASELHRLKIEEAWSLHIQERGGVLATFSGDLPLCMSRFLQGNTHPVRTFQIDRADSEKPLSMVEHRRGIIPAANTGTNVPAIVRPDAPIMRTAATTTRGKATFAATWAADADVDVHVRCARDFPFLNFHHADSPEGHHVYDYQQSPGQAYEIVEMTREVDLRQCEFYLNLYAVAHGPLPAPPSGKVRIEINHNIWEAPFQFGAGITSGNSAGGFSQAGGMEDPHWIHVNIPAVLLLEPTGG